METVYKIIMTVKGKELRFVSKAVEYNRLTGTITFFDEEAHCWRGYQEYDFYEIYPINTKVQDQLRSITNESKKDNQQDK